MLENDSENLLISITVTFLFGIRKGYIVCIKINGLASFSNVLNYNFSMLILLHRGITPPPQTARESTLPAL